MKKSTRIILLHLALQVFIGVLATITALDEFAGQTLGGLGVAMVYVSTGAMCIIGSAAVMFFVQKQPGPVVFKGFFFALCLWIAGPFIPAVLEDAFPGESYDKFYERKYINPTLKAAKEMGFKNCKWDNYRQGAHLKLPDGQHHYLFLNTGYLNIYTYVKELAFTDTLGWMSIALLEASTYLQPQYIISLNRAITNKDFEFNLINNNHTVKLKLGTTNPYDPPENWIEAESIGKDPNRNKLGNIRIGMAYREQMRKE